MIQELARKSPQLFEREIAGAILLNTTYTNPLRTMVLRRWVSALQKPVLEPMCYLTILLQPLAWLNDWQSYLSGSAHLANRFQFGKDVTRRQLEHTTLLATRNPPAALAKSTLGMFRWQGLSVDHMGVPTLIIGGDIDIVTKAEASRAIKAKLADSRLKIMGSSNHMGVVEQWNEYRGAITDFAKTVTQTAEEPLKSPVQ